MSHKGRPQQEVKSQKLKVKNLPQFLSLKPQAKQLARFSGKKVIFIRDFNFDEIKKKVFSAQKGSVFLLENLRFLKGEEKNDGLFAKKIASLGDFYVNDAFAVSHRANASIVAIAKFMKSYAGFELESEIKNLTKAIKNPQKPLIVMLGGLKIEDKLRVYDNLKNKTSKFLIGGALNKNIIKKYSFKNKIIMPVDFKREKEDIRDVGPKTVKMYCNEIKRVGTIIWNGPLGVINKKQFQNGTKQIMKCVVSNKKALKIIGGGETVAFFKKMKLDKKINFISTGGGAMLDFLAGKELPGIVALK